MGDARLRLVALDLDGVVWKGGEVLPGVAEALREVLRRGLEVRYVSNNSTAHRETVSQGLERAGLPAGADRVLTSGFVTAQWLRQRLPTAAPVMVIGEEGLVRELRDAGLGAYHAGEVCRKAGGPPLGGSPLGGAGGASGAGPETASPETAGPESGPASGPGALPPVPTQGPQPTVVPAAVVVGMDRSFSYQTLAVAQAAILSGALFVATNQDATFPTPGGLRPGAGSLVAAVATAAGSEPVLMGKPGLALAEILAAQTGIPPGQTLFIGDRLSTDIAMGRAAGMVTALVLTGVTSEEDLKKAEEAARAPAPATMATAALAPAAQSGSATDTKSPAGAGPVLPDHVLADLRGLPALLDELLRA